MPKITHPPAASIAARPIAMPRSPTEDDRAQPPPPHPQVSSLASYHDETGRARELVILAGAGRRVVIDRDATSRSDARLLGELAQEEEDENARLLVAEYLGRSPHDRRCAAYVDTPGGPPNALSGVLHDPEGNAYWIQCVHGPRGGADLRWMRRLPADGDPAPVTLRTVIGALEAYEPATSMTVEVISAHPGISGSVLRRQIATVRDSHLVLNRGLRDAVVAALDDGTALAQIAESCGHTRPTARGGTAGDSAWLARRVGLKPDGQEAPYRWIDERVLCEIAEGLGLRADDVLL